MGTKGGTSIPVTDYRMSLLWGVCNGEVDSFNRIRINEKSMWCGNASGRTNLTVKLPDLMGGDQKEGGVEGVIELYAGSTSQKASSQLADRVNATPDTTPGHRRLAVAFLRGIKANEGFKYSTNNPYFPKFDFSVTRLPKQLSPTFSTVYSPASIESPYPVTPIPTDEFYGERLVARFGGKDLLVGANNGFGAPDSAQGQYMDWTLWGWDDLVYTTYDNGWLMNFGSGGTLIRDFRLSELGLSDYDMINGSINAVFEIDAIGGNTYSTTLEVLILAVPEDVDGLPDPSGATLIARSGGDGVSNASAITINTAGVLPANTKWLRCAIWNVEYFGPSVGARITRADVTVKGETLRMPHCPSVKDSNAGMGALPNANPAHMIYECLTDRSWGRGFAPSIIDDASFMVAAETLFNEGFGMYMSVTKSISIDKLIAEILSHIQANVVTNLRTGLIELKLLRNDYDVGTLVKLDSTNSVVSNFKRRTISETSNEIIVSWTDPANEKKPTVVAQDVGNVIAQGGDVRSVPRDYYGVRSAQLAQQLAERDLASMSALIASFTVSTTREFWDTKPGDVFLVDSSADDVTGLIARVNKVTRGGSGEHPIVMECVEDVFGLEHARYTEQPVTNWTLESNQPTPFVNVEIQTAPYAMMSQAGVDADTEYPRVMTVVAGEKPNKVTSGFDLFAPTVTAAGETVVENRGSMLPTDYGELVDAWVREPETKVTSTFYNNFTGREGPEVGTLAIVGTTETASEIIMFNEYNTNTGDWTVSRGMLDTVPQEWPIGTPVWFMNSQFNALDQGDTAVGESVDFQLRSSSDSVNMSIVNVPIEGYTVTSRPTLPFRPANVKIDSVAFAEVNVSEDDSPVVTWSERDRLTEDSVLLDWDDATVTPEVGQTTHIIIRDAFDALVVDYAGLTAVSKTILNDDIRSRLTRVLTAEVFSDRDGLSSLQSYFQDFSVTGYGENDLAVFEQSAYIVTGKPRNQLSVVEQSAYIVTGVAPNKLTTSEQTSYIVSGNPRDELAVSEQSVYIITGP